MAAVQLHSRSATLVAVEEAVVVVVAALAVAAAAPLALAQRSMDNVAG